MTYRPNGFLSADAFEQAMKDGLRQLTRSTDMTKSQRDLVYDMGTRGRYIAGLRQLAEIARVQCQDPADAVAWIEQIRGFVLAGHVIDLTEGEAMRRETEANRSGDVAQIRRAYLRCRGSLDQVVEAMTGQEIASRALADVLHRERPALIQVP